MKTIWKYRLEITDRQTLRLPEGAVPLSVQLQAGSLTLWVEVDTTAPERDTHFHVVGTGNALPEKGHLLFIGTVQMLPHVWHVYEEYFEEENHE